MLVILISELWAALRRTQTGWWTKHHNYGGKCRRTNGGEGNVVFRLTVAYNKGQRRNYTKWVCMYAFITSMLGMTLLLTDYILHQKSFQRYRDRACTSSVVVIWWAGRKKPRWTKRTIILQQYALEVFYPQKCVSTFHIYKGFRILQHNLQDSFKQTSTAWTEGHRTLWNYVWVLTTAMFCFYNFTNGSSVHQPWGDCLFLK